VKLAPKFPKFFSLAREKYVRGQGILKNFEKYAANHLPLTKLLKFRKIDPEISQIFSLAPSALANMCYLRLHAKRTFRKHFLKQAVNHSPTPNLLIFWGNRIKMQVRVILDFSKVSPLFAPRLFVFCKISTKKHQIFLAHTFGAHKHLLYMLSEVAPENLLFMHRFFCGLLQE